MLIDPIVILYFYRLLQNIIVEIINTHIRNTAYKLYDVTSPSLMIL